MTTQDIRDAMTGCWTIVSWEQLYDDGRRELPLGDKLEGFIRYGAEGDMVCMIARAGRLPFVSGGQWSASDAEKAAAYGSMLSYAGRYTVEGEIISHYVDLSLFPNWKGGVQKRHFRFLADGMLALDARLEAGTPQARIARLVWRKRD